MERQDEELNFSGKNLWDFINDVWSLIWCFTISWISTSYPDQSATQAGDFSDKLGFNFYYFCTNRHCDYLSEMLHQHHSDDYNTFYCRTIIIPPIYRALQTVMAPNNEHFLTLVMLNKLRCHTHFQFSVNQITWSRLLTQTHILNGKQCRSRSVGFRSQLIWIYTVCKDRVYPSSEGLGLN